MKKFLLFIISAMACVTAAMAETVVFSYNVPSVAPETLQNTANGGTINYGTLAGSSSKFEVVSSLPLSYKLDGDAGDSNTRYVLVTLSDVSLRAGDVIDISGFTNGTAYAFALSDTRNGANNVETSVSGNKVITSSTYTVVSGDCLIGKNAFYITRTAGHSIYFNGITITRNEQSDPSSPVTYGVTDEAEHQNTPEGWAKVDLPVVPAITSSNTFDITNYGASTGSEDNKSAIQKAINAANAANGGMVYVPAGTYLSGPLQIKSKVILHLAAGATLKMLPYGQYPAVKDSCFIRTPNGGASDVIIEGEDKETCIIDGQGAAWWAAYENNGNIVRPGALIRFYQGARYLVKGITLKNAPNTNLALGNSGKASHFTVHDIKIQAPASDANEPSHNTDGIPIWGPYANIYNCDISTGDDNIVVDSDGRYIHAWDCDFGTGHGASIGSYTVNVHDIIYEGITFNGTESGFKIKSQRGRSGDVYNVIFRNSTMTRVRDILMLDCWYDRSTKPTPEDAEAENVAVFNDIPKYHDILFQNITATDCVYKSSAKNGFPVWIYGLPESYIYDVTLDNVKIDGRKGMHLAFVDNLNIKSNCSITTGSNERAKEYKVTWYEEYPVKFNSAGWGSFSAERPVNFADTDMKAYMVSSVVDDYADMKNVGKIPASTGVFVKGEPNTTANVGTASSHGTLDDVAGNMIQAIATPAVGHEVTSAESAYALATLDGVSGLYNVATGVTIKSMAYLSVPASLGARPRSSLGMRFENGETDGIAEVSVDYQHKSSNALYNLNGQRLNVASKGIVVDGKGRKYIVK